MIRAFASNANIIRRGCWNTRAVLLVLMASLNTVMMPVGSRGQSTNEDTLKSQQGLPLDTLSGSHRRPSTVDADLRDLKKITVSGFVQARYEHHQDAGNGPSTGTVSTGKNQAKLLDRFYVRRGRLKAAYQANPNALGVVSLDGSASGIVLKDAFVSLTESYSGIVMTVGQFKWLFGYEGYPSSTKREFPERVRWWRTLFPGDRDRGLKLERSFSIKPKRVISLQAEICNGNGIEDKSFGALDPNKSKDIVVRAAGGSGCVEVGLSGYWGRQFNPCDSVVPIQHPSTTDKIRYGADARFLYEFPHLGAGAIRAEAVIGEEPRNESAPFLSGDTTRNVLGFDLVWVQSLPKKIQWISRVDYYDPNRDVTDDHFITWGFGLIYSWDANSKVKLVYEMPKSFANSRTGTIKENGSVRDEADNILTLEWIYAL